MLKIHLFSIDLNSEKLAWEKSQNPRRIREKEGGHTIWKGNRGHKVNPYNWEFVFTQIIPPQGGRKPTENSISRFQSRGLEKGGKKERKKGEITNYYHT